jgi:NAD(P)H-dependent nitrite reductase small subunit
MSESKNGFVKVCKLSELKEGTGSRFIVDDVDVAIFKLGDEIFAINNLCVHQHASILHDGFVEEEFVTCPAHGWQFSLRTGRMPEGRRGVNVFETMVENEDVLVKVYKKELNW